MLQKDAESYEHPIIAERFHDNQDGSRGFMISVIENQKKYNYIEEHGDPSSSREEYYDLAIDPGEERNIIRDAADSDDLKQLRKVAAEHIERNVRGKKTDQKQATGTVDDEHLRKLKALGYLN
jgi:hypothetical protein